ncbi:galactoside alpha-(1,2)-fucosyltransferase 1-like [Babylonia areolata]|uniref:galactoside alpha-(1,2)-fucosyltransferase 1-like n=1 Tax=Babylonia areolata TaxID=304850 RepID=UPI003FD0E030
MKRCTFPTLFLLAVTAAVFVLAICFIFTMSYNPGFLQGLHQLHEIVRNKPPLKKSLSWVFRSPVSESEGSSPIVSPGDQPVNPGQGTSVDDLSEVGSEEKNDEVQQRMLQSLIDAHTWLLLRGFSGRLGNVLFELASAFCIAKLNNRTLIVDDSEKMHDLRYQGIRVSQKTKKQLLTQLKPLQRIGAGTCCGFEPKVMTLEPDCHHILGGFLQSWKYFEPCKAEVKRVVLFKDSIVDKAVRIMADLREKLPRRTLVGVHVRMEDYLNQRAIGNGKTVAPPDFYRRAMTYFRSNFRDVTFLVFTSKSTWFRTNVTDAADVVVFGRTDSAAVDMEVLSRMDHLIFSVGTFGWWAGYKHNGTVVCYKHFYVPGSYYGNQMWNNGMDFIYKRWILL